MWDGRYDVEAIVSALKLSKNVVGKPVFINIRTVIGVDMASAGTAKAHHGGFDAESISTSKRLAGLSPTSRYEVPDRTLRYFEDLKTRGVDLHSSWNQVLQDYESQYPELAKALKRRICPSENATSFLKDIDVDQFKGMPTREVNGILLQQLWGQLPEMCGGGADLVNSNKIAYDEDDVFDESSNYRGRYIRHGIREVNHRTSYCIMLLLTYLPSTRWPRLQMDWQLITRAHSSLLPQHSLCSISTYVYLTNLGSDTKQPKAAPGVRMGALSNLQVIHIATHDSFGRFLLLSSYKSDTDKPLAEGQNGPTHQPVELDSLYRAMPNFNHIRPCDAEELLGAWAFALSEKHTPSMISVARDPVSSVPGTSREKALRGAYVVREEIDADVTLVSCGSNLHYVISAVESLARAEPAIKCRVVSAPCLSLFAKQDQIYREGVIPLNGKPVISVEEYVATVWARYCTASIGMTSFGYSASNESNYRRFGLDAEGIEEKVKAYLNSLNGASAREAGWRQL